MKTRSLKLVATVIIMVFLASFMAGCIDEEMAEIARTQEVGNALIKNQPSPTDVEYSLERFNLIRRAYWVNGEKEKALRLECSVERPDGFVVLYAANGTEVARFVTDGKVTSLNSYLSPDSTHYTSGSGYVSWLPDVDGSYGQNDGGIFFFVRTDNGDIEYVEWNGLYLYTSSPPELAKLDTQR